MKDAKESMRDSYNKHLIWFVMLNNLVFVTCRVEPSVMRHSIYLPPQ